MEETIKSTLIEMLKKQIMAALIAKLPSLSGGFLNTFVGYLVGRTAKFLVEETVLGIKILKSNIEVISQVKKLQVAIHDSKREDLTDEQKEKILERIRRASDSLISF